MSEFQDKNRKIYAELLKSMLLDYVVNDLSQEALAKKYKITPSTMKSIVHQYKFKEKRVKYQDKVLEKSLTKMADRQSNILNRLTMVIERQVSRLEKQQVENPDKIIDPNRMKEILTAFGLISKEYRLDNNKPTDNNVSVVRVEMGSTPIISENHVLNPKKEPIEVESTPVQDIPTVDEVKVVVEQSADIKDDDPIFGSID